MLKTVTLRMCTHCGAVGEERLGYCDECQGVVCAKCGNVQYVRGERKVLHDICLKHGENDSTFTMIKFVR